MSVSERYLFLKYRVKRSNKKEKRRNGIRPKEIEKKRGKLSEPLPTREGQKDCEPKRILKISRERKHERCSATKLRRTV